MTPLRIDWELDSPMAVPERPIQLDALLARAVFDRGRRAGRDDINALLAEAHDRLPLEKSTGADGQWVYQASSLEIDWATDTQWLPVMRKIDLPQIVRDSTAFLELGGKDRFEEGNGHYKLFNLRQPIRWASGVRAWAVGDTAQIQDLVAQLHYIGRMTRNGLGRVRRVTVSECPQALANWRQRPLPHSLAERALPGHIAGTGTLRPPYWRRENWQDLLDYPGTPALAST